MAAYSLSEMFDHQIVSAVTSVANQYDLDPAALMAITDVQSGGKVLAVINGRAEPLIKFEWHYFQRRLSPPDRARAGNLCHSWSIAHSDNCEQQISSWALLNRAVEIDAQTALESAFWGVGEILGMHWRWLGFTSVSELADLCRRDVAGQVDLMMRYIDRAGLTGDVRARDWESFARGFNGRAYRKKRYHLKLAAAHGRWTRTVKGVKR